MLTHEVRCGARAVEVEKREASWKRGPAEDGQAAAGVPARV